MVISTAATLTSCGGSDGAPRQIEQVLEDCRGYVQDFAGALEAPAVAYSAEFGQLAALGGDAINCTFDSLKLSDQVRARVDDATGGESIQLYEGGLSILAKGFDSPYVEIKEQD